MQYNTKDICSFFEQLNCPLKVEEHNRVFPQSDDANDIIFALKRKMKDLNIKIEYNTTVEEVTDKKIITNKGT
jgi:predicted flavoprotein YhiN